MSRISTIHAEQETRDAGKTIVHIPGESLSGFDTLCGHCDRTDYRWIEGRKKATCTPCLRIWRFVKEGALP
jgi:hypothetical protein